MSQPAWLVIYRNKVPPPGVEPEHVTHPNTNRARRRVTSLIRPTLLPLRHAATLQHRTVLIIFPPNIQSIIIGQMLSIGEEENETFNMLTFITNNVTKYYGQSQQSPTHVHTHSMNNLLLVDNVTVWDVSSRTCRNKIISNQLVCLVSRTMKTVLCQVT